MTIEFRGASIGYRGVAVVEHVSAILEGGVLLLGPNGAGKTTLLRAASGLADVYSGSVLVDGVNVADARGAVGLLAVNLPEAYTLLPIDALRLVRLYADLLGTDSSRVLGLLSELGLDPSLLRRRRLWELSAGQAKMVTTAVALASGARNVLLDEPFEQLDPARKTRLLKLLQEQGGGSTVVVATHETWVLRHLHGWRAYIMVSGRLWGPVEAELLADSRVALGEHEGAILTVDVEGRRISFLPPGAGGGAVPVSQMVTLDRLYELLVGGGAR